MTYQIGRVTYLRMSSKVNSLYSTNNLPTLYRSSPPLTTKISPTFEYFRQEIYSLKT